MATNLQSALEQLAAFSHTDHPFLSVYVDWTVDGNGQRPAVKQVEQELDRIHGELDLHGDERAHFEADVQRVKDYLNNEAPDDASGLAVFACAAENAWMTLALHVPVETDVVADRFPHVFELARVVDDYETFGLVLAEGQEARIMVVAYNQAAFVRRTKAGENIKRFDQGGQAQMLFQRRTENIIKAHMKDLAAELGKVVDRYDVQHIVVASNDAIKNHVTSALDTLPEQVRNKVVDYIKLDPHSDMQQIMEAVEPIMERVEREQEQQDLTDLQNKAEADGAGVVGVTATAAALTKGQVRTLMLLHSFGGEGRECPNCGMLRAGTRANCPYDGTEMHPVDLREAFAARAMQQSATVQVVESSEYLDQHEGVGALLYYRDASQERTVS